MKKNVDPMPAATCWLCSKPIAQGESRIVLSTVDGHHTHFHGECYANWKPGKVWTESHVRLALVTALAGLDQVAASLHGQWVEYEVAAECIETQTAAIRKVVSEVFRIAKEKEDAT